MNQYCEMPECETVIQGCCFRHPFRSAIICCDCYNKLIQDDYDQLKERIGTLYIRDEIKQI